MTVTDRLFPSRQLNLHLKKSNCSSPAVAIPVDLAKLRCSLGFRASVTWREVSFTSSVKEEFYYIILKDESPRVCRYVRNHSKHASHPGRLGNSSTFLWELQIVFYVRLWRVDWLLVSRIIKHIPMSRKSFKVFWRNSARCDVKTGGIWGEMKWICPQKGY